MQTNRYWTYDFGPPTLENMTGNVCIAGAGIGGLTAALALHARGIDVTVIERTDLHTPGVGINLLPHAVRELCGLGLGDELAKIAVAPAAIAFYDTDGTLLFREPRGVDGGYGYPQYSVHRGRLQSLLLSTTRNRLGVNAVRDNTELTDFEDSDAVVHVRTSAGNFVADVLVGADGIHSTVRRRLHPEPDRLLSSGRRLLRGVIETDPFLDGKTMSIIKSDNGIDLVVYPIGDGLLNWVVMLPEARPADRAEVIQHLGKWHLDWLDAADLVRRSDPVLEYPMVDRDPLPRWGRGRVTLLGDAAHPMYPVGANGGSQAIVDASVLAAELSNDVDGGLRRYEDRRRAETARVVEANREMHHAGATQCPAALARVTARYRVATQADRSHA